MIMDGVKAAWETDSMGAVPDTTAVFPMDEEDFEWEEEEEGFFDEKEEGGTLFSEMTEDEIDEFFDKLEREIFGD